jgi:Zn-dependent protease with chaperone function
MRQRAAHVMVVAAAILVGRVPAAGVEQLRPRELIVYDGADAPAIHAAVLAAVRLLPRPPARIAVIDADDARPEVRPTLLRLDAFVTVGSPVVYVVRQSRLLDGAVRGSALHTHALAAVIWHEMAHVGGADERQARRQEEALWLSFIRDQRINAIVGLRYLKSLVERPDDLLMAAR